MADEIKGTATFSFRVQDLTFEGVTFEQAKSKMAELRSGLEELGARVISGNGFSVIYPRFEPDSPSVAATYVDLSAKSEPAKPALVLTQSSVEDFLATTDERFRRFPIKSFWDALCEHSMLAHPTVDDRPPCTIEDIDTYDVPSKKQFYVGMEPCECSLRGYGGYWALDPFSIINVWQQWDEVQPGRLFRFGARKQEFLGTLARQLEGDLGEADLL